MKKVLFLLIACLIITPQIVLASPGELDQYGGHSCYQNCDFWGYEYDKYHYHFIPAYPNFFSGNIVKNQTPYIFYSPIISSEKRINEPAVYPADNLIKSESQDNAYCGQSAVFASGRYNSSQKVRIKPVCAQTEKIVIEKKEIKPIDYYTELPIIRFNDNYAVEKVYHYTDYEKYGRVFTDRPNLDELKSQLIKGVTDIKVYYVPDYEGEGLLREISAAKAKQLFGQEYKEKIIVFGDSIIYSYRMGHPMDY